MEEELQEQEFLDRCFQEMLDEEDQDWFIPSRDLPQGIGQLQQQLNGLSVSDSHSSEDILVRLWQRAARLSAIPWAGEHRNTGHLWCRGCIVCKGEGMVLLCHSALVRPQLDGCV